MSITSSFGLATPFPPGNGAGSIRMLTHRQVMRRLLAFTGYTIHDVINDPIARNAVVAYYRLYRQIEDRCARDLQTDDDLR